MALPPDLPILRGDFVPAPPGPRLLHRILEAVEHGGRPALLYHELRLTFSELNAAASRLARALARRVGSAASTHRGNADGDVIVAVGLPPSERLVVALLAVWKVGAAYLPLDPAFAEHRVRHMLDESQPALVVSDLSEDASSDLFQGVAQVSYADLAAEAAVLSAEPLDDADMVIPSREVFLAIVCYTSGSSGVPKGVRITHSAVLNRLSWQWRQFPYGPEEDMFVFKTALTFVDAVAELWGPLLQGRTVLVLDREVAADTDRFVNALEEHRIQRLVVVPSLLRAMLLFLEMDAAHHARATPLLSRIHFWVSTGESLPLELAHRFFSHFSGMGLESHTLCNYYGSTEMMGDVTYHVLRSPADLRDLDTDRVPIGRPINNTVVYVLDEHLRPALAEQSGEVFVAGASLALGYVAGRDPQRFIRNPFALRQDQEFARLYRTGDFARVSNGVLEYEGRADSQVKVRGRRVHLSEIEAALERLEEVDKGVVLCYHQGEEDQEILAFVTLRRGSASVTGRLVETLLRASLPPYAVPHVRVIERVPLLLTGKVDRQALLRDHTEAQMEPDYSNVPEGKVIATHVLLDTVSRVLGASARMRVSLNRSFFELGGDSLNSVSTVSRLREHGFFISVRDFIKSKTLGEVLEKMKLEADTPSLTEINGHHSKFHSEPLGPHHKHDVYSVITDGFLQKGDLEMWIMPRISPSEYYERMDLIWDLILEKGLSFVVTDSSGTVVGCALLFDAEDEPDIMIKNRLSIIFDFLRTLEDPIREERLPGRVGAVLHSLMVCTSSRLTPRQNVLAVQFLEQEVLRMARERGFSAVYTTNTSPLTQQLGRDVFGYQTLVDYQVNQYVSPDGSRPFEMAPDDQRVHVSWKYVGQ